MHRNIAVNLVLIVIQGIALAVLGAFAIYYTVEDEAPAIVSFIALYLAVTSWGIRKIITL